MRWGPRLLNGFRARFAPGSLIVIIVTVQDLVGKIPGLVIGQPTAVGDNNAHVQIIAVTRLEFVQPAHQSRTAYRTKCLIRAIFQTDAVAIWSLVVTHFHDVFAAGAARGLNQAVVLDPQSVEIAPQFRQALFVLLALLLGLRALLAQVAQFLRAGAQRRIEFRGAVLRRAQTLLLTIVR